MRRASRMRVRAEKGSRMRVRAEKGFKDEG